MKIRLFLRIQTVNQQESKIISKKIISKRKIALDVYFWFIRNE